MNWLLCILAVVASAGGQPLPAPLQFRVWGRHAAPHPYLKYVPAPVPANLPTANPADVRRGFIILGGGPADADPAPHRCLELDGADAPGGYGSLDFGVYALADLDVQFSASPLKASDGSIIGPENLDVREVQYVSSRGSAVPLLLEKPASSRVPAGGVQWFRVTYFIPPKAHGAIHIGKLTVRGCRGSAAIPIRLRVYPFRLREPDCCLFIYYSNSTDAAGLQRVRSELADQRCHGMTAATLEVPVTPGGDLLLRPLDLLMRAVADAGFPSRQVFVGLYNRIIAEWLNTPDRGIGMYGPWFRYYPFSPELDDRYAAAVGRLKAAAQRHGLKLVLAVADEPGSHPWTTSATQHYSDLVRSRVPDVHLELDVGGGWAMGRDEETLWRGRADLWMTNRWLPQKLEAVRRTNPGVEIGIYNMAGGGSTPGEIVAPRFFYGFYAWKARAAAAAQWVYFHPSTPDENYTWPAREAGAAGVPTLRWEMVREGAKDLAYVRTLEALLANRSDAVARDARRFLAAIAGRISVRNVEAAQAQARIVCEPARVYDEWRRSIADFIIRLSHRRDSPVRRSIRRVGGTGPQGGCRPAG